MPRQKPLTDSEATELREAVTAFQNRVADAYDECVTTRAIPGSENADIEVVLNTRAFPTEADGPLDLGALFAAAHDLGFEPVGGVAYTIADIGTANTSSRVPLNFAYTYD